MKTDIDNIIHMIDDVTDKLDDYFYNGTEWQETDILMLFYKLRTSSAWLRVLYGQGDDVEG